MKSILITGATGNVGLEVIRALHTTGYAMDAVVAGVRNPANEAESLRPFAVHYQPFDFLDLRTYQPALEACDILFLLRPPQISDVNAYFKPLIDTAKTAGLQHIVFLSVQGVENSSIIPHHKIEALIRASGIPYTFLRPAYFMQNFTTTLLPDLRQKHRIFLPAGRSRFTVVDVRDIGRVAATVLQHPEQHINTAYDLTNAEKLTFQEMADQISTVTGQRIDYQSPNLLRFFLTKRREGTPTPFILVMILLHYFPRFQPEPVLSDWVEKLTGRQPLTFRAFLRDHQSVFT